MTELLTEIRERIAANGPMDLSEYMAWCLSHAHHGYYMTRDPFGADGDFVTAPEISQMFGEMLGGWLAQVWRDQGEPAPFVLAELGPGRGTLMRDAMRVFDTVPGFLDAALVFMVETSPVLRSAQTEALRGHAARWIGDTRALPDGLPLFILANEFFDALPIEQYQRVDALWRRRRVTASGEGLAWDWSAPRAEPALEARAAGLADGAIVEVNPAGEAMMGGLSVQIEAFGGALLIVDYGRAGGGGDTLQALRAHGAADVLAAPGETDLTTHVDFSALIRAGGPARVSGPLAQGTFLDRLGMAERARVLARTAPEEVMAAYRRLTDPDQMGEHFKALAVTPKDAPMPPGFDP